LHFIDLAGINEGEIKGGLLNYKNLIQYDLLDTNAVLVLHNVILQLIDYLFTNKLAIFKKKGSICKT